MSASIFQENQTDTISQAPSLTITLTIAAGSGIHLIGYCDTVVTFTFSDNNGNTYPAGTGALDLISDGSGFHVFQNYILNANAGSTAFTLTLGANHIMGFWVREVRGCATASLDNHGGFAPASSTTPSANITINNSGALISALCSDWNTNQRPGVGSGYSTGALGGWTLGGNFPSGDATTEQEHFTSTGSTAVNFTLGSADISTIMAMVFDDAPSGVASILMGQACL